MKMLRQMHNEKTGRNLHYIFLPTSVTYFAGGIELGFSARPTGIGKAIERELSRQGSSDALLLQVRQKLFTPGNYSPG